MRLVLTEVTWAANLYRVEAFDDTGQHLSRVWFVDREQAAMLLLFALFLAVLLVIDPRYSVAAMTSGPLPLPECLDLVWAVTMLLYKELLMMQA
jgi:hypothetical protein